MPRGISVEERPDLPMKVSCNPRMIRLVIIEDQRLVQEGMMVGIRSMLPVELVTAFRSREEIFLNPAALTAADVALIDLNLGDVLAFDFLPALRSQAPDLKLIWVSSVATEYLLSRALAAGLEGFVHKDDQISVLVTAIERVMAGAHFVSETVHQMQARFRKSANHFNKLLSEREQELLGLLGKGLSNLEVSAMLGLTPSTVQTHRRNIMGRLGLHTGAELQAYALKAGFTTQGNLQIRSAL